MREVADLVRLAEEESFEELESAWLEAAEDVGRVDVAPFLAAADVLSSRNERDRAATLLALLVPGLREAVRAEDALRVVRRAIELKDRPDELRPDLIGCLRAVHGGRPGFEAYLRKSVLREGIRLAEGLAQLDRYLDFPVGCHVYHAGGWGIGRVVAVDRRSGDLTIDFERRKGHVLPIESACDFLQRLPDDHLFALRFSAPQQLEKLREDSPGQLVKIVLRSRPERRAGLFQVKKELCPSVVSEKEWARFWSRAKADLVHDPLVEVSDDARPVLAIRDHAVRYSDEILAKIAAAGSLAEARAHAQKFLRQSGVGGRAEGARVAPDELKAVAGALAARLARDAKDESVRRPGSVVEAVFLLEDFSEAGGGAHFIPPEAEAATRDLGRFVEIASTIEEGKTLRRFMDRVRSANPGWVDRFAASLASAPKDVFALVAAALAEAAPEALGRAVARLATAPDPDPEAFVEMASEALEGRFDQVPGAPDPLSVFERLVSFAERIERLRSGGAPVPNMRPRIRALLEAHDFAVIRRYFTSAGRESFQRTYQRILSSTAITDEVREVARGICVRRFPDLLASRRFFWEDGSVYETRRALEKRRAEFEELTNVKIPENARAIGAAAAHGDVSDNAEFTAALEERDRLVARADAMRREMEKVRLLEEAPLTDDVVAPGTRIELRNMATGLVERYSVLGPHDADAESGVIAYTAPLAQGLLGRRAGELAEVTLPNGERTTYQIVRIERVPLA